MKSFTFHPIDILRIFIGSIFISAGIYRIFHFQRAVQEFSNIFGNKIIVLLFFTIALEIIGGFFLVLKIIPRQTSFIFIFFLASALFFIAIKNIKEIAQNFQELFFLDRTPTDLFLHLTYLVILIAILLYYKKNNSSIK